LSELIDEYWDVADPGVQELGALRGCRDSIDRVITTGMPELIRRARGGA
jgi:hypothetical protein